MSESTPATGSTWRLRIWSVVVRLPLWAYIVVAILLLLAAAVWGRIRPIIREQQSVKRLQQDFGATIICSRFDLKGFLPGATHGPSPEPLWDRVIAELTDGGTSIPETFIVVLSEHTSSEALRDLPALRSIQNITLMGAKWTDRELSEIATRCRFQQLVLHNATITAAGWHVLARLPLDTVALQGQTVGPEFFRATRTMPNLGLLMLHGCTISCNDVTLLAGHPTLTLLSLVDMPVNSDWIDALASIPDLANLDLSQTAIDDRFLSDLGRLKSLGSLAIDGTKVTDAGLAAIPAAVHLDRLELDDTGITEAGLMSLKNVPRNLSLVGTKVRVTEPLKRWFLAHSFDEIALDDSQLDPTSPTADELSSHIGFLNISPATSSTGE